MADTWLSNTQPMSDRPLIFEAKNAAVSLKGEYLLPALYDEVLQPGDKVEGWVVAEYPKGIKYASSIGEVRISLLASDEWIASKAFDAHPNVFGDRFFKNVSNKDFYFAPLDTMITEDR
jgi:hypothetical protein